MRGSGPPQPRGRRGSPPMQEEGRGTYPPPPPASLDGRRRRSPSPLFRRSPPPKRFRRDEEFDRFGQAENARYDDRAQGYDRRGPPPPPAYGRRHDDRYDDQGEERFMEQGHFSRGRSPPRRQSGPKGFKEFLMNLPDEVTPTDAKERYDQYLADYWGSQIRAEFEQRKDENAMRQRFDPREHLKAVEVRATAAADTAAQFAEDFAADKLNPSLPTFHQGNLDGAASAVAGEPTDMDAVPEAGAGSPEAAGVNGNIAAGSLPRAETGDESEGPAGKVVPEHCWAPERVATDLVLSRELAAKLDAEKEIVSNPHLVEEQSSEPEADAAADATAVTASKDGTDYEQQVGKLDQVLTWLWRVHGVDYYAGVEVAEPDAQQRTGARPTLRCPRPEEGEQPEESTQKQQAAILEVGIDAVWRKRIQAGDPFQKLLQQDKLSAHIDAWVVSQIVKHEERKWGSLVSAKLFMDREYVVKHIHNKHQAVIKKEKEKFWDDLYFQNFKAERDAEQRHRREAAQRAAGARSADSGAAADQEGGGARNGGGIAEGLGGSGGLLGGPFGRGGMPGVGMPGMPDLPPGMMLVPAEGAGPLGPFIPVPVPVGGVPSMGLSGPVRPAAQHMGGPSRQGGMMGGRGGGRMGMNTGGFGGYLNQRQSDYQDLDDPRNNRTVLDYGDL